MKYWEQNQIIVTAPINFWAWTSIPLHGQWYSMRWVLMLVFSLDPTGHVPSISKSTPATWCSCRMDYDKEIMQKSQKQDFCMNNLDTGTCIAKIIDEGRTDIARLIDARDI